MNVKNKVVGFRPVQVWLVVALSLALIPVGRASAKGIFYYDFANSVKPWVAAAQGGEAASLQLALENDPKMGKPTNSFAMLQAGDASFKSQVMKGYGYAPLPLGTWMEATVDAPQGSVVRISLLARYMENCEGCTLKLYVGREAPESIMQFVEVADQVELTKGWQSFSYKKDLASEPFRSGQPILYVALGWSGTDASVGFDNVMIQIMP